jgi:L-fucose mutarotase
MEVVGAKDEIPEVQRECQAVVDRNEGKHVGLVGIERHAFYDRAKQAFAIVATGELRPYGCLLLTKGVYIPKDGGR